jgi:5-methylcytosine-specific restriction endonuclease McrA
MQKPLKYRSKKKERVYAEVRRPLVAQLLNERPNCQRCQTNPSQDIHEVKTRARGGSITDIENLRAVCRPCHNWITTNPKKALETGWLKNSWD